LISQPSVQECRPHMSRKERRAARKSGQADLSQSFAGQLREMGDQHAQAGDLVQALTNLGKVLYALGQPDDAIAAWR